jgi:hypothetical protein
VVKEVAPGEDLFADAGLRRAPESRPAAIASEGISQPLEDPEDHEEAKYQA